MIPFDVRTLRLAILPLALVFLTACAEAGKYPVSGEQCGPNDPVKDMTAGSCLPS